MCVRVCVRVCVCVCVCVVCGHKVCSKEIVYWNFVISSLVCDPFFMMLYIKHLTKKTCIYLYVYINLNTVGENEKRRVQETKKEQRNCAS